MTARLTGAVRYSLSGFSVLVTGFTCFFMFSFHFALVVPPFLRFHLDLSCYVPSSFERSYVSGVCLPSCRFRHHALLQHSCYAKATRSLSTLVSQNHVVALVRCSANTDTQFFEWHELRCGLTCREPKSAITLRTVTSIVYDT